MIQELIEKLQNKKSYEERMSIIYMWIKQEYITKLMFIRLVEEVNKMNQKQWLGGGMVDAKRNPKY